jgi:hypothetical protein
MLDLFKFCPLCQREYNYLYKEPTQYVCSHCPFSIAIFYGRLEGICDLVIKGDYKRFANIKEAESYLKLKSFW